MGKKKLGEECNDTQSQESGTGRLETVVVPGEQNSDQSSVVLECLEEVDANVVSTDEKDNNSSDQDPDLSETTLVFPIIEVDPSQTSGALECQEKVTANVVPPESELAVSQSQPEDPDLVDPEFISLAAKLRKVGLSLSSAGEMVSLDKIETPLTQEQTQFSKDHPELTVSQKRNLQRIAGTYTIDVEELFKKCQERMKRKVSEIGKDMINDTAYQIAHGRDRAASLQAKLARDIGVKDGITVPGKWNMGAYRKKRMTEEQIERVKLCERVLVKMRETAPISEPEVESLVPFLTVDEYLSCFECTPGRDGNDIRCVLIAMDRARMAVEHNWKKVIVGVGDYEDKKSIMSYPSDMLNKIDRLIGECQEV